MEKTNANLVEWCKRHLGDYYWMGCFCQMPSAKLYEQKKAQYPKYYTAKDYASQIANPKPVTDCAGLIKGFCWSDSMDSTNPKYNAKTDYGATAFYEHCTKKGKMATFDHVAGRLVFKGKDAKMSHVGVYIGDGKVIEAKGHAYGVVMSNLDSKWTHWGQCNLITEDVAPTPQPTPEPTPTPTPAPTPSTQNYKVKTNGSTLALRVAPNAKAALICWMPNGSKVTVDRSQDGWNHTTYKGKTGWAYGKWMVKI